MSYGNAATVPYGGCGLPAIMPVADVKTVVTCPEGVKPVTLRIVCTCP